MFLINEGRMGGGGGGNYDPVPPKKTTLKKISLIKSNGQTQNSENLEIDIRKIFVLTSNPHYKKVISRICKNVVFVNVSKYFVQMSRKTLKH